MEDFFGLKGENVMFLSVFKEKKLEERIARFFSRLNSGKLKSENPDKKKWVYDSIELTLDETVDNVWCYFEMDHRSIYIIEHRKKLGVMNFIVEREEYLRENGVLELEELKDKIRAIMCGQ